MTNAPALTIRPATLADETIGCIFKYLDDIEAFRNSNLSSLRERPGLHRPAPIGDLQPIGYHCPRPVATSGGAGARQRSIHQICA